MLIRNFGIIIILFTFRVICFGQQQTHIQYTIRDGLPTNYVYKVFQDSKGFIWFGTDAGVSRFNGFIFENFSMQDGLADNDIFDIMEDQQGRIWFATYNGRLCYFEDQKFHNSVNDPMLKNHDFNSYISSIYEDTQGNIWFSSLRNGIIYLAANNTFHKVPKSNFFKGNLRTYPITYEIWQNGSEDIIALTSLSIVNLTKRKNVSLDKLDIQIGSGNSTQVKAMTLSEDTLLITENGNFHLLDNKALTPLIKINFNSLNSPVIFLDKNTTGDIWAGTYKGVFQIKDSFNGTVNHVNFLNGLTVSSRTKDIQGNVWYTTLQNGVYFIPQNNIENFTMNTGLPEKAVNTISGNNLGTILIGQGDYFSFINKGKITSMTENPYYKVREVKKSYEQKINYVSLDDQGQYLIASNYGLVAQQQGDILYYPGSTNCATNYKNDSILIADIDLILTNKNELLTLDNSSTLANHSNFKTRLLKNSYVNSLCWSKHTNTLWIGSGNGLMMYKDHNMQNISTIHPALKGRISDIIESAIDKSIWVATDGYGILQLNKNGQPLLHISTNEGLSSNRCNSISEDKEGDIWVATSIGLNKINFQHDSDKFIISQYGKRDGLLSDKINDVFIGKNKVWVATDEGLSAMDFFNQEEYIMPLYITSIKVNGYNQLFNKDQSTLSYDRNNISVNFVALDYRMVGKMSYRYKIKESHDWNYTTNNNVEFSSLAHGNYSFTVQAKNKQGVWSDQVATFNFTISPPLWATWWAYLGYFLLCIGIIYVIFIYEFRRKLLKSELQLEKKESSKIKELEQLKSHFFSNISHEFRTPLTLILGPLEQIINKINDSNIKRQLQIVSRNASGLLQLINQLLDISKLESGKLSLHLEYKDIMLDIETITGQFEILVKQKGIHFEVQKNVESLIMKYDPKKMEIILNNLLSNAIKFTPKGGSVILEAYTNKKNNESNELTISVSDTGIGISKNNLSHIFERFYQENPSVSKEYEGTGIGLSLTKDMVELHQGSISVNSVKQKGSTFTIVIPIITNKEKIELPIPQINNLEVVNSSEQNVAITEVGNMDRKTKTPTILVVEDNAEMRLYLKEILSENYQVILAENGEEGIQVAKKLVPELIVSDVMMPKISGIELCTQLKQHELTCHIPIILLTAKAATESKVEGYETGAEAYLTKPFSHLELKVQVKNLINQRIKLQKRFKKELGLQPEELDVSSIDQQFLKRALKIVEENMDNSSFTVFTFAKEFGSSREHISRKIKGLTGQTTSEFIRTQRLKRAAQLLTQKSGNVAEIGYSVGFTNPAYFSRCFTKLFGISPSQYPIQ
ncbi:MAG: ATP-binding protein [Cyclobacteriaceae bacterium]|nr:ATP-binding protein [Cyclobacteriaceae bacterium]